MSGRPVTIRAGDVTHLVVLQAGGSVLIEGAAEPLQVTLGPAPGEARVVDGDRAARLFVTIAGETAWVFHEGRVFELAVEPEGTSRRRASHHRSALAAPMPATVVSIKVEPGDAVSRGETLIVLEAMKMELPVRAPADGRVAAIHCREGELVQPGVILVELS